MSTRLDFVRDVWRDYLAREGYNALTMSNVKVMRVEDGFVEAHMTIEKHQINRRGDLHGGMVCSLVDTIGSLALSSKGLPSTGASTDIHTTFIRGAGRIGDTIRLEGRVLNLGKNLAYTETKVFSAESDKIVASGLHTKYVGRFNDPDTHVAFDKDGRRSTANA